mmetsp:Transcript_33022/g.65439  ORF Transcript_33022/g.65439 Transcript_33022/m.65439 type:complete len:83 (+) Transcript_33022:2992-3240(+)
MWRGSSLSVLLLNEMGQPPIRQTGEGRVCLRAVCMSAFLRVCQKVCMSDGFVLIEFYIVLGFILEHPGFSFAPRWMDMFLIC